MLIRWTPGTTSRAMRRSRGRERVQLLSRFSARERHVAFWVALWTAAVAAELAVLRPALVRPRRPDPGPRGRVRLRRRLVRGLRPDRLAPAPRQPQRRADDGDRLRVLPPGLWGQIDAPLAGTLATWLVDLWSVLFVALLVSLLTAGRLESTVDKLLVFAFVLPLLILNFVWLLFTEEVEPNLLLAFPTSRSPTSIDTTQRSLLLGACLATVLVLGLRWRAATRPRRRALLPTIAGSFVLLIYSALLINDLVSGERSEPLLWIASCSLVTVPLAFLAGLLRSRLARSGLADLFRDLRNLDHDALQATLARALGDPGLRLAYAGADGHAAGGRRRALGRAARARRPPVRRARLRPVARRRSRAGRGGARPPRRSRWRTSSSTPSRRCGSPS